MILICWNVIRKCICIFDKGILIKENLLYTLFWTNALFWWQTFVSVWLMTLGCVGCCFFLAFTDDAGRSGRRRSRATSSEVQGGSPGFYLLITWDTPDFNLHHTHSVNSDSQCPVQVSQCYSQQPSAFFLQVFFIWQTFEKFSSCLLPPATCSVKFFCLKKPFLQINHLVELPCEARRLIYMLTIVREFPNTCI